MSQAFSQTTFALLSLFPSAEQTIQLECPSQEVPKLFVSQSENESAIAIDKFLIITGIVNQSDSMDVLCEVEFDNEILAAAWDASDKCLAVVDSTGTVHLMKKDGSILLSRKVSSDTVMGITFYTDSDASLQSLAVFYEGGKSFVLKNIDINSLTECCADDKIALASALKSMKLEILDLQLPLCRNFQVTLTSDGIVTGTAIDESTNFLISFQLRHPEDISVQNYSVIGIIGKVRMFFAKDDQLYVVTATGVLAIYDLVNSSVGTSVFVSSSLKSIIGMKFHQPLNEAIQCTQLLLADEDGARFSCTIVKHLSTNSSIVVPHGRENMEQYISLIPATSHSMIWLQVNENSETVLCQFSKIFNNISNQLDLQICRALQSPSTKLATGNFAVVLGQVIASTALSPVQLIVDEFFESVKPHKFPAETMLLMSFLMDYTAVTNSQCDLNVYLNFVQTNLAAADSDVGSEESRKLLKKWRHYVSIVNSFRSKFPENADKMYIDALSPDQIQYHLDTLLTSGQVDQALFLLTRLDVQVHSLHVASVPHSIHADFILQFIVWQRAHAVSSDREHAQVMEFQTAESLYHRAEAIISEGRGKESISLCEYGLRMAKEQDCSADTVTWQHLRGLLQSLLFASKVVVFCGEIFGVEYSLEEVQQEGIEGIVFERLDSSTPEEVHVLASESIPQLFSTLGIHKDDILLKWLQTTIESSILNEDENDETSVIVEKLVFVCDCVEDVKLASQAVLKLFQIPNLEILLKRMGSAGTHIVQKADLLCNQLTDVLGEKLHEALRSFRLKVIASKYGVEVFDLRDKNHLMMLVSIICNNRVDNVWVEDLSYCAYDRGMVRMDLHPVLVRILVSESSDASVSAEVLRLLFLYLPDTLMTTVIDDSIKVLLNAFNQVCDACYPEGYATVKTAELFAKYGQTISPETYIVKAKAFIDFYVDAIASRQSLHTDTTVSSSAVSSTSGSLNAGKFRLSSCSSSMENLISQMRNLHSEYDIFMSSKKLQDSQASKKVLESFIKSLTASNATILTRKKLPLFSSGNNESIDEFPAGTIVHLQKIATLMNLSPQFAVNEVLKQYLSLNKKKLALKLVYWNSEESLTRQVFSASSTDRDFSGPLSSSANLIPTATSTNAGSSSVDIGQDHESWNMLVSQALNLNTAALKHNKISSQYGYAAMAAEENDDGFEKSAFTSSAKILSDTILDCDENSLCSALDCLSATSTTLRVFERFEQSVEQDAATVSSLMELCPIFNAPIPSDGLLMQQEASIPLLSAFCIQELHRRAEITATSVVFGSKKRGIGKSVPGESSVVTATDLERLVEYFQKTENHILALQVLSQTWALDTTKARLLKASLVALCRKLLTYRDINYDYAIACLSCLPMETMFQELKMAVPTIQNNFARLHHVALIGEELSFLWDQERQLELFQSLQSHAKWWHLLSSIGLKIDMKAFQHSDVHVREVYVQSLIPSILQNSGLNLELTLDYCRSFDVHPEYASLQYIELMLSLPPSVDNAQENLWISKIALAASGLDERQLTTTLYRCLPKIHALDYERIMYVCHWIVNLAPGQVEDQEEEEDDDDVEEDVFHEKDADNVNEQAANPNISFLNTSHVQLTGAQKAMVSKKPVKLTRQDVETCKKYIDTIQYLSSLIFSTESIDSIKSLPSMECVYNKMKGHFAMRIPFWTLISTPWAVLTPILTTASPALMEKLLPLCYLLGINKEEFTARSLHSMFQVKKRALKDAHDEDGRQELKRSFVALVDERAMLFTTKLKVWRLVFKSEKNHDKDYAIFALRHGLQVVEKVDEQRLPDANAIRRSLMLELTKLQVEDRIRDLLSSSGFIACHSAIFSIIDKPNVLLMKVFEALIEHAWHLQCSSTHHATGHGALLEEMPRIYSVTQLPTLCVLEFLSHICSTFAELAALLHQHPTIDSGDVASNAATGAPTLFDVVSHEIVSRLLTENAMGKDTHGNGSTTSSASSGNTASHMSGTSTMDSTSMLNPSHSGSHHGANVPTSANDSASGFWRAEKQHPVYAPSDAEYRRREDSFFGFALICVLALQTSLERKSNFLQQLDVIMRGVNRNLRRITTRSRYRAAIAVHYFQKAIFLDNNTIQPTPELSLPPTADTYDYLKYLYCLSEMHELRLTSAETSLQSALGIKLVEVATETTTSGNTTGPTNRLVPTTIDASTVLHTRSLIITWLHDEGGQVSVVELARDLFFLAPKQDPTVLHKLFRHMLDQDFRRSVFTSLAWWEQSQSLRSALLYGDVTDSLVLALWQNAEDAVGKFSLCQTQLQGSSHTHNTSLFWLSCGSTAHQQVAWPRIFDQRQVGTVPTHADMKKSKGSSLSDEDDPDSATNDSTGNGDQPSQPHKSVFCRQQVTFYPRMLYTYSAHPQHTASQHSSSHHHNQSTLDVHLEELLLTTRHITRFLLYFLQSIDTPACSQDRTSSALLALSAATFDFMGKFERIIHSQQLPSWMDNDSIQADRFASLGIWQLLWPMWQCLRLLESATNASESLAVTPLHQQMRSKVQSLVAEIVVLHVSRSSLTNQQYVQHTCTDNYVGIMFLLLAAQQTYSNGALREDGFVDGFMDNLSNHLITDRAAWVKLLLQQVTGWDIIASSRSLGTSKISVSPSRQTTKSNDIQRGLESIRAVVSEDQHQSFVAAVVQHCIVLSKAKPDSAGSYAAIFKSAMEQVSPTEKKILLLHWKQQQIKQSN